MKKLFFVLSILTLILLIIPSKIFGQGNQLDLASFMAADFLYNGFTSNDSYLEVTHHEYSFTSKKYLHTVSQATCPSIYNGDCKIGPDGKPQLNWHFYYLGKKSPDQNIIYQSKIIWKGNNLEVFWYNDEWIYDFMEPAFTDQCPVNDQHNPVCFHNFHNENNSDFFPNRGFLWYKRFFNSGDQISVPFNYVRYYKNNEYYSPTCGGGSSCTATWPPGNNPNTSSQFAKATYYPNWNPAETTWNSEPEYGYNLPSPLEVVVLESILTKSPEWPYDWKEKYYYAKSGNNTFGLIRYDRWEDKNNPYVNCGDDLSRCPGIKTDGNLVLAEYATLNILTKFSSQNTTIDRAFIKSFYSDPKFESIPSNETLSRGKIYVKSGRTAKNTLITNDYLHLTEILTDGDWLINTPTRDSNNNVIECPNGYKNQGSLVTDLYDHRGNFYQNRWAILCGTNTNVILATICPSNYISRGSIDTSGFDINSAYEYDVINNTYNAVGGQTLNLCVQVDETRQSNKVLFSTPTPLPGDIYPIGHPDGKVNIFDYNILLQNFSNTTCDNVADIDGNCKVDIFDYNILVGNFGKTN